MGRGYGFFAQLSACSIGLLAAIVPCRTQAQAQVTDGVVSWYAPAACPAESAVRQSTQSLLDESLEPVDVRGIHAHAVVVAIDTRFALELVIDTPLGRGVSEHLEAPHCETLAGVVSLELALAAARSAAPPENLRSVEVAQWSARVSAGLVPSGLPGLGPVLELAGARRSGPVSLELGAGFGLPNTLRYASHTSIGARFELAIGLTRACLRPALGRFQLPICLGTDIGVLRATGFGIDEAHSVMRLYCAAALESRLLVPVTAQLSLLLGVEGRLALTRPSYVVRNLERLYTLERAGASVRLGAAWIFE